MWFRLFTSTGRHYQFREKGFPTRYHKGVFEVFIRSIEDLELMTQIFSMDVIVRENQSLELCDGYIDETNFSCF